MSQYQNPSFQPYGGPYSPNTATFQQSNNWLNPSMLPPQQFDPSSPQQAVTQPTQQFANGAQQGFRASPYHVPQRISHPRSLSLQLPQSTSKFDPSTQSAPAGITTPQDSLHRRLSLSPHALEQQSQAGLDGPLCPPLSRTSTTQSVHPSTSSGKASPSIASGHVTPQLQSGTSSPVSYPYGSASYPFSSQVLNTNPLSMSMPPESQQFIGSALDRNDPRTAMFMAGSENLPQPFAPTYTYNPNISGKTSRPSSSESISGMTRTLSSGVGIKAERIDLSTSGMSEGFFTNEAFLTPGNGDYNTFFDFQGTEFAPPTVDEQGDGSNFVNWD